MAALAGGRFVVDPEADSLGGIELDPDRSGDRDVDLTLEVEDLGRRSWTSSSSRGNEPATLA